MVSQPVPKEPRSCVRPRRRFRRCVGSLLSAGSSRGYNAPQNFSNNPRTNWRPSRSPARPFVFSMAQQSITATRRSFDRVRNSMLFACSSPQTGGSAGFLTLPISISGLPLRSVSSSSNSGLSERSGPQALSPDRGCNNLSMSSFILSLMSGGSFPVRNLLLQLGEVLPASLIKPSVFLEIPLQRRNPGKVILYLRKANSQGNGLFAASLCGSNLWVGWTEDLEPHQVRFEFGIELLKGLFRSDLPLCLGPSGQSRKWRLLLERDIRQPGLNRRPICGSLECL